MKIKKELSLTPVAATVKSSLSLFKPAYASFVKSVLSNDRADRALTQLIRDTVRKMPVGKNLNQVVFQFEVIATQALIKNEIKTTTGKADKTHKIYNTVVKTTRLALQAKGKGYVLQLDDTSDRKKGIYPATEPKKSGAGSASTTRKTSTVPNDADQNATVTPDTRKITPTILHDNLVSFVKGQSEAARAAGFSEVAALVAIAETLAGLVKDYTGQADDAIAKLPTKFRSRAALLKRIKKIAA